MSKCNHFWRAIDSRRSQCRKCREITKSPCREPECVALQEDLAGQKRWAKQVEEDRDYWKAAHGKLAEETSQRELKYEYWRDKAKDQVAENAKLKTALEFIAEWQLPRVQTDSGECSYGVAYGSNGERNYMIAVAKAALQEQI